MTISPKSWRDVLPVHPAAEMFPMMNETELRELGEDIKANGLRNPIAITCKNVRGRWEYALLDGRNRLDAMELAGVEFKLVLKKGHCYFETPIGLILAYGFPDYPDPIEIDGDPYAYVISANIHRRHLPAEARRDLIARLIEATPEKSNRQIAKIANVSHHTVGGVRDQLEGRGQIAHVGTRTDSIGRQQQAHKPVARPADTPVSGAPDQYMVGTKSSTEVVELVEDTPGEAGFDCDPELAREDAEFKGGLPAEQWAIVQNIRPLPVKEFVISVVRDRFRLEKENAALQIRIAELEAAKNNAIDWTPDANGMPASLSRQS
jgi:hypothetical protein